MKKEDFEKLSEEEKAEIKSWFENPQGDDKTNPDAHADDPVKPQKGAGDDDVKPEAKVNPDPNENENENEDDKEKNDFKKSGADKFAESFRLMNEKQDKIIQKLSETESKLIETQNELKSIKKRSPMGNYTPLPSDDYQSKSDKKRDEMAASIRAKAQK